MSIFNSGNIVTNGLVFNMDMYNIQSYKGPPVKNFLTQIEPRSLGVGTYYNFTAGTENVYIPTLGPVNNCAYVDMYNDYNGGSGSCCPSPYGYGQGFSVTGSTQYTYGILYKSVNGYTNANWMYHYEYNGGTYITEYGVFNVGGYGAQVTHLGDDWYWGSAIFTTNVNCNLLYTGSWMYEYARYNRFYVAKVLLVPGDYRNLHPKYWPNVNATRSNTQAILDLTNNNTITATSLTYASDGTFSFNANGNYISLPNVLGYSDTVSAFAWIKTSGSPRGGYHIIYGGQELEISIPTSGELRTGIYTNARYVSNHGSGLVNGNWHHIGFTFNGTTKISYINGISVGEQQSIAGTLTSSFSGRSMGVFGQGDTTYGMNGFISSASIYNRALSASEVLQNFNAQRGLYGI